MDALGLYGVPVGVTVLHGLPYSYRRAERTPEQTLEAAYVALEHQLAALSQDTQLLSKTVKTTWTDSSLILECTVQCIANIAVQAELEIIP